MYIYIYFFETRYYETKESEKRDERVIRARISLLSRDNFFFSSSDSSFFSRVPVNRLFDFFVRGKKKENPEELQRDKGDTNEIFG